MSALAISPLAEPSKPERVAERDSKSDDFKGTLKTAQKKPPAPQQQIKKPVADDNQQPLDASPVQQLAAVAQQVAAPIVQDLSSMISAGKSLVGTAVAVVDANQAVDEAPALEPVKALANTGDALPMTPLEQAVHDVLERLHDDSSKGESTREESDEQPAFAALPGVTSVSLHVEDKHVEHVAPVEGVRELPEQQQVNQSHVHLVIDDGERLVMTIAVRGDQVITHIRGDNAETTAALARNAGVLDDHLRARGLSLGELQATHDQSQPEKRQGQHDKPHYDQPEREQKQPRFSMEENL